MKSPDRVISPLTVSWINPKHQSQRDEATGVPHLMAQENSVLVAITLVT